MSVSTLTLDASCHLNGGLAWAACGKPLVLKYKTPRLPDLSIDQSSDLTTARFPTGYSGLWKTLVSVPDLQDYHLTEQAYIQELTPAGFPQPLLHHQNLRLLLLEAVLFSVGRLKIVRAQSAHRNCIRLGGLGATQQPRDDFSAWAFSIGSNDPDPHMWGMGQFEPIGNRVFMTQRRKTMGHKNLFLIVADVHF